MRLLGDVEAGAFSELLLRIGSAQHQVDQNGQMVIPAGVGTVKHWRSYIRRFSLIWQSIDIALTTEPGASGYVSGASREHSPCH